VYNCYSENFILLLQGSVVYLRPAFIWYPAFRSFTVYKISWSRRSRTIRWVGCFRQSNRCAIVSGATPHSGHRSDVPEKMQTL